MVSIVIIWVVKKLQNRHHLWEDRGRMKEWQTTIQVTTISSVIRVFDVPHVLQAYVKPKVNLQGHPVTSLHGKIVPSQIVPLIVRSFHNIVRTFPESLSYEQNKSITRTVNPCTPARCLIPSPDPRHKEAAIIILNISNTMRIFSNHTNRFVSQEGLVRETIKKDTHQIINICSWKDKSCHIGIPMQ